jgi:DNA repair exonuclease SbcCD nuclease subunit
MGIFSDLHIGVESDSKTRLDETRKCVRAVIDEFSKRSVDWVVFCGDLFNSRYSINVNTLNIGIEIVQELAYNFSKVFLIAGNHDTYYKNSNSVNSVSFLGKLTENGNVYVVDETPKFVQTKDCSFGMYPWGYDLSEASFTPDYGFGHFEFNGAELAGSISSGCKYNLEDLFKLGKRLFSGHYHKPRSYETAKGKRLEMIGSPLQLDWGDYGQNKRALVLDTSTGKIDEIMIGDYCAKFSKVYYSSFKEKKYDKNSLKELCEGNFVKFVIDIQYSFEDILKCSDIIKKLSPLSLEFDYMISSASKEAKTSNSEMTKCKSKLNDEYLVSYIESVFSEYAKTDESLSLDVLKSIALSYFNKAMQPESEREENVLEDER